jgi:hypothetical protein
MLYSLSLGSDLRKAPQLMSVDACPLQIASSLYFEQVRLAVSFSKMLACI